MLTLNTTPFRMIVLPPVLMLVLAYVVEFYNLLPARIPILAKVLPQLPGDVAYLEPGLFSICTHLYGSIADASKLVADGGLGYRGIVTTLEGMCQELHDWNCEQSQHASEASRRTAANGRPSVSGKTQAIKSFRHSVGLAEEIRKLSVLEKATKA